MAALAVAAVAACLSVAPASAALQDELATLGFWQRWTRISALATTPDGYLWIATNSGLIRHDGQRFVTFGRDHAPALPSYDVRALAVGRDGSLFVGLDEGGGLWRLRQGDLTRLAFEGASKTAAIRSLAEGADGAIWIGTTQGLLRWSNGRISSYLGAPGAPAEPVTTLATDRDGRVFAGTAAGVYGFARDTFRLIVGTAPALDLAPDGTGGVYVARDGQGIVRVDMSGRVIALSPLGAESGDGGAGALLFRAVRLIADGTLYAGTTRGLERLRDGRWEVLPTGIVDHLVLDHEGSFWLGRNAGGLIRVGTRRLRVVSVGTSPADARAYAVLPMQDESVFVAFSRRILRIKGSESREWGPEQGLNSTSIRSLAMGRGDVVWIGTLDSGVFRLQGDTVAPYPLGPPGPPANIQAVHEDAAGRLWVAERRGPLWAQDTRGGPFRAVPLGIPACSSDTNPSDCLGLITGMLEDPRGGLWIGTRGAGLVHVHAGQVEHFGRAEGLASDHVACLFIDSDGIFWIGTEGAGLVRRRDRQFASLGFEGGLPLPNVYGITEDRAGNLWLGSEGGILRVKKRDIEAQLAGQLPRLGVVSYDTADGMLQTRVSIFPPAAARARDGHIWFATSQGAVVVTPPDRETPLPPPHVVLEDVRLDGKHISPGAGLELPTGRGTLELRYTAPSFAAPHRIRFRYRLEGHDGTWIDAQDRRVASYSNLPSGTYSFQVRASFEDLDWGRAEASMPFRILSFYQRPPFWAAMALAVLLLAWLLHRLRIGFVRARFSATLVERNRIARDLHDSLAQYLSGIGYQLERLHHQLKNSPDKARDILRDTKQMVALCRLEARQTIWNLRSQDLQGRSLGEILGELSKQLRLSGSADVTVSVTGRERPLPRGGQAELMRIVQEATANALVHGHAHNVRVSLAFGDRDLCLRIEDDGAGFVPGGAEGAPLHFGLVGMHERAERIGGRLSVDSQPGQGATVEVVVPLAGLKDSKTESNLPLEEPAP